VVTCHLQCYNGGRFVCQGEVSGYAQELSIGFELREREIVRDDEISLSTTFWCGLRQMGEW